MGRKEKQWFYRPEEHKSYWNREEHTKRKSAQNMVRPDSAGRRDGNSGNQSVTRRGRKPLIIINMLLNNEGVSWEGYAKR